MESLGRYTLLERLGSGAWGEVFKAKSFGVEGFEKTIAVKRVFPELAMNPAFVAAFVHQAKRAIRLSHANIAQAFDLGHEQEGGKSSYYLAGEYVAGVDLQAILRSKVGAAPLPLNLSLHLVGEVAKALEHAHRRHDTEDGVQGIVHGTLCPSDVLLSFEGEVKVTDFCVAGATLGILSERPDAGWLLDKLPFLSPELLRDGHSGPESDIYALGALLFRLLAGRPPFVAAGVDKMRAAIISGDHAPLNAVRKDVAPEVAALVQRCLELRPERRHQSAAKFYEELLALSYAMGARFGGSELSDWLETVDLRARPGSIPALEEVLEEIEPEELVPSSRPLDADVVEVSGDTLHALSELPSEREISVLSLGFQAGAGRAEAVRMRARGVALRYGGRELSADDAGLIFVFGLEPGDTRDADNAARSALVMLRAVGPLAAPMATLTAQTSPVVDGKLDDGAQATVLATARALPPGQVGRLLATDVVARRLREVFPQRPGPTKDCVFLEEPAQSPPPGPFVGRRAELRTLAKELSSASRGGLRVVSLVGPHGIGKTRLLNAAIRRLSQAKLNVGAYVATCPPRGHDVPYSGVTAMLRALTGVRDGDALDGVLGVEPRLRALGLVDEETSALLGLLGAGPAAAPNTVEHALARALSSLCAERLHILAWDDAHELDADSARTIGFAMDRLARSRAAVVLAGRRAEPAILLNRDEVVSITLGDLELEDTLKLACLRLGVEELPAPLQRFLHERAGGHPMFAEELLREALATKALVVKQGRVTLFEKSAAITVPRSLRMLVADRLRRLPDAERGTLVATAILQPPADLAVVASVLALPLGLVHQLVDGLTQREILLPEGTTHVMFASQLVREVVLSDLDEDRRYELHRRAADAYQVVLGVRTEEQAAQIGYHLAKAGDSDRASGFYATSGLYHTDERRLDVAARHFMRALTLADLSQRGPEQIGEWVAALSNALRHVRSGEGLPDLVRKISGWLVLDKHIDGRSRGAIEIDLAVSLGALHRYKEARRLLQRAAATASTWPELARGALLVEAELSIRQGEVKTAETALERAAQLPAGDALDEHRFFVATAQARAGAGHLDDALLALDAAAELVPADDVVLSGERDKVRALIAGFRGDWAECARISEAAAEQARNSGLVHEASVNLHNQGDSLLRLSENARAYAVLGASRALAEEIGSERLVNLNTAMMAYLDALKGDRGAAETLTRSITRAETQKWTWDVITARYLLGRLLAHLGDTAAARRELTSARNLAVGADNQVLAQDCSEALRSLEPA